jgi:hypothetical protein
MTTMGLFCVWGPSHSVQKKVQKYGKCGKCGKCGKPKINSLRILKRLGPVMEDTADPSTSLRFGRDDKV